MDFTPVALAVDRALENDRQFAPLVVGAVIVPRIVGDVAVSGIRRAAVDGVFADDRDVASALLSIIAVTLAPSHERVFAKSCARGLLSGFANGGVAHFIGDRVSSPSGGRDDGRDRAHAVSIAHQSQTTARMDQRCPSERYLRLQVERVLSSDDQRSVVGGRVRGQRDLAGNPVSRRRWFHFQRAVVFVAVARAAHQRAVVACADPLFVPSTKPICSV